MKRSRQGGFVITLEFVLIMTILVIGAVVGLIALRNALFELREKKLAHQVIVKDSTAAPTGPIYLRPVSYDLCEAPQILCRDPTGDTEGLFALVGIRPDRFVSRDRIYYTGTDCTGAVYIAAPDDSSLPVGYLNALQGVSYGVGSPDATTAAGVLYRSAATAAAAGTTIQSVWTSLDPDCLFFTGADPVIYSDPMPLCQDLTVTGSTFDAGTRTTPLRSAVEVVDSMGRNLLQGANVLNTATEMVVYQDFTLPFNVMAFVPGVTYLPTPGGPGTAWTESAAPVDPGGPYPADATTDPGGSVSNPPGADPGAFPDAGPESEPPPP